MLFFVWWALAPTACAVAIGYTPAVIRWLTHTYERLRPPPPQPLGPPIERIAADLRRIAGHLDQLVAAGPIPGRILRVRTTTAAYDDTLLRACRALDVDTAALSSPMSSAQRLQTEAALSRAGLVW